MVDYLEEYFNQNANLVDLKIVSDGICNNNLNRYIDFDAFIQSLFQKGYFLGDNFSSPDTILFNKDENHIIFVEFKDMNSLETMDKLNEWWNDKNKSVYLKMTDAILGLSYYFKNHCDISYDDFMNINKSFFYVYKSDSYKKRIKNHLSSKLSRYSFLFKNIRTAETKGFEKFISDNNL